MPDEHVIDRVDHRLLSPPPEDVHRARDQEQRQHEPQQSEDENRVRIATRVGRRRDDRHDDVQHEKHAQRRHHDPSPEAELVVHDGRGDVDPEVIVLVAVRPEHGLEPEPAAAAARALYFAHAHRLRPPRGVYDHDPHALVELPVLHAVVLARALSHGGLGLEHGVEVDDGVVHRRRGRPAVGDLEVGRLRGEALRRLLRVRLLAFAHAPRALPRVDEVLGKRAVAQLALRHPGLATPPRQALRVHVAHGALAPARLAERGVIHEAYPALASLLDVVNQIEPRPGGYRAGRGGVVASPAGIVIIVEISPFLPGIPPPSGPFARAHALHHRPRRRIPSSRRDVRRLRVRVPGHETRRR
mmetsp:Transcript_3702/g.15134  ORF Transcript_3702/g.15134 Transcript_3702/m.15134 type:complete len:357 (+) Transcript_3702:165-1235(+)